MLISPPSEDLRRRFLQGTLTRDEIEAEPVLRSWARAEAAGLGREGERRPAGLSHDELLARRELRAELVQAASTVLDPRASRLNELGIAAMLADVDGVVLHATGGSRLLPVLAGAYVIEGSTWTEAERGTSAIGAALAEQRAVQVVASAHSDERAHNLHCHAEPLHGADGRLVGVLSFAALVGTVPQDSMDMLQRLARALEHELLQLAGPSTRRSADSDPLTRLRAGGGTVLRPYSSSPPPQLPESQCPQMLAMQQRARWLAPLPIPVLIEGEVGCGRERLARAIHAVSGRGHGPLVVVRAGAHEPGALNRLLLGSPSPAGPYEPGRLQRADGGSLVIEGFELLDDDAQRTLLHLFDSGSYVRQGELSEHPVDVRLIAVAGPGLGAAIEQGRLRPDLYLRVAGARLSVPPLREREDKLELAATLLAELAVQLRLPAPQLAHSARDYIRHYDWPGNVHELRATLSHAMLVVGGTRPLERSDLPQFVRRGAQRIEPIDERAPESTGERPALSRMEAATASRHIGLRRDEILRQAVQDALTQCGGNISRAASQLGIARSTIYRMLRRNEVAAP